LSARVDLVEPLVFGKWLYANHEAVYLFMLLDAAAKMSAVGKRDMPGVVVVEAKAA
jgi:hypothetical protein